MDLKLKIYEKREVVKTYTTDEYDLMYGTLEDVFNALNLDDLRSSDDVELIKFVTNAVVKNKDIINHLLKDVFDGLTDDELRHAKVKDIASILVELVKFTIEQISIGASSKN